VSAKNEFGLPGTPGDPDAPWSQTEKLALNAWTAPLPPADFVGRVLAGAKSPGARPAAALPGEELAQPASHRGRSLSRLLPVLAAAAAVLVVAVGLVSFRQWFALGEGQAPFPAVAPYDAGPMPEVRPPYDGIGIQPS